MDDDSKNEQQERKKKKNKTAADILLATDPVMLTLHTKISFERSTGEGGDMKITISIPLQPQQSHMSGEKLLFVRLSRAVCSVFHVTNIWLQEAEVILVGRRGGNSF